MKAYDSVILFSGGIDSTTILLEQIRLGKNPLCLLFDYDQPHKTELKQAKKIAKTLDVDYLIEKIKGVQKTNSIVFGGRNLLFIATAVKIAIEYGVKEVFIGCNSDDKVDFKDCRDDFISSVSKCALAYDISILAPLSNLTKKEVIEKLNKLDKEIMSMTWTCYKPAFKNGLLVQCGECYSCLGVQNAKK